MIFIFQGKKEKIWSLKEVFSVLSSSMNGIGYLYTGEIGTKERRKLPKKNKLNGKDA